MSYAFRIKSGSDLDTVLKEILNGTTSQRDLRAKGLAWTTIWAAYTLSKCSDNFAITRQGAHYSEVIPTTLVKSQSVKASSVELIIPKNGNTSHSDVVFRFPDTPTIMNKVRNFRKPSWYDAMSTMIDAGRHIALSGPPGVGKSTAVEYLAAERGIPLVNIGAEVGLRKRDLTGQIDMSNGSTWVNVAEYAAAAINGWWVKIDEVNAAEPDALLFLNSQMAPPYCINMYGRSFPVHTDFRLFITYNPGLVGTKPLPDSFKDRFFPIKIDFPTDAALRALLQAHGMRSVEGMNDDWMSCLLRFARECWTAKQNGRMRYAITPRRLMDAVELVVSGQCDVFKACDLAVISAVDNPAEVSVLESILKQIKQSLLGQQTR